MPTTSLQSFYSASAGVAGALIGLLFVAVYVARDRSGEDHRSGHRVRAGAALTAFTNTLCVSLFGLIEHGGVAIPAAASAIAGVGFVLASLLSLVGAGDRRASDFVILGLLTVTFSAQLFTGRCNTGDPAALGVQQTIAIIVVICFLGGIARSWELIGGPRIGVGFELHALLRHRRQTTDDPPARRTAATGSRQSLSSSRGSSSATGAGVDLAWSRSASWR